MLCERNKNVCVIVFAYSPNVIFCVWKKIYLMRVFLVFFPFTNKSCHFYIFEICDTCMQSCFYQWIERLNVFLNKQIVCIYVAVWTKNKTDKNFILFPKSHWFLRPWCRPGISWLAVALTEKYKNINYGHEWIFYATQNYYRSTLSALHYYFE